jgi:hypothetical protein
VAKKVKKDCAVPKNCPELFFGDNHPKALGYKKVASLIAERFKQDAEIAKELFLMSFAAQRLGETVDVSHADCYATSSLSDLRLTSTV